jgi:outer membrane protein OmpA-like peptidoglycan-associated protein
MAAHGAPKAASDAGSAVAQVLFGVGKSDLTAQARQEIASAAQFLAANAGASVALSGYADRTGSPQSNLELAKQRAFAVRDALKSAGVAEQRIELRKPKFVIAGAEAQARRVDILAVQ